MKILSCLLSSLLFLSLSAQAEPANIESLRDNSSRFPMKAFDPNLLTDSNSWISNFEVVIWVNKANQGTSKQSLTIWRKGQLWMTTKVSTGREQWEKERSWFWGHGPKNSYFSSTNIGYYTPEFISPLHKSKLWRSKMPWSIFFDGGIAIHQAPDGTEGALGSRASGGCVRVSRSDAPYIFSLVKATENAWIPKFSRGGDVVLDANGNWEKERGYSTLIIVEDRITY